MGLLSFFFGERAPAPDAMWPAEPIAPVDLPRGVVATHVLHTPDGPLYGRIVDHRNTLYADLGRVVEPIPAPGTDRYYGPDSGHWV